MSGGQWDYIQYKFSQVVDDITDAIEKNGKKKSPVELSDWERRWIEEYPENGYHQKYPYEVIHKFKEARLCIAEAQEYIQRLDWLFSGDDGDDSYLERLEEGLKEVRQRYEI